MVELDDIMDAMAKVRDEVGATVALVGVPESIWQQLAPSNLERDERTYGYKYKGVVLVRGLGLDRAQIEVVFKGLDATRVVRWQREYKRDTEVYAYDAEVGF